MLSRSYAAWSLIVVVLGTPGRGRPNRSASRFATAAGTMLDTSPPNRATSRTRLDDRNEYCGLVEMKNVSMPDSRWFICAIWSS